MNWQDVIDLKIDDKTDAELAVLLPPLTASDIPNAAVRVWLRTEKLWYRTAPDKMGGTFAVGYDQLPTQIQALLDEFYAAVFGGASESLHTNQPEIAAQFSDGLAGLKLAGLLTDEQVDAFTDLDGGRPYKDETEASIASARAAYVASEAARVIADAVDADVSQQMNDVVNPAIATSDRSGIVVALRAAADAVEAG